MPHDQARRSFRAPQAALSEVPSVLLDATSDDLSLFSAVPDSLAAARRATQHLVDAGHRRIAHITVDFPTEAAPLRVAGYRDALTGAGIGVDDKLLVTMSDGDQATGREAARLLLELEDPPTAVFCFNDRMAMGVYQTSNELGVRIPEDLSVVGFDDQELIAADLFPPLTTMALPHYEMGRWAIDRLLSLSDPPEQVELPCPLIERDSVGPPRT
jgi:LacI family transcriptional regulator, galactose operon repressor